MRAAGDRGSIVTVTTDSPRPLDDLPDLAPPLTHRPLVAADATAVHRVAAAQERADRGRVDIEVSDIVADWQRPGFDVPEQVVGVHDDTRLVGYGEVGAHGRADAAVDPGHRGRGIGTWLAGWIRATAAARGEEEVGMPVPEHSAGDRLLAALGWQVRWTSWLLETPAGGTVRARPLPPGYHVRAAHPGEHPAVHAVLEDAFLEWSRRPRETTAEFEAAVLRRPGFADWNVRVVLDPSGEVVGAALVHPGEAEPGRPATASVPRLAVRREHRGRGLAQAVLADAVDEATRHGAEVCVLSTDSRTGALGLYRRVGMEVVDTWVNRGLRLR